MRFRLASATLAALLIPALLAGCASDAETPPHVAAALTPTEQFPIEVAPVADEILLAPHGRLSPAQSAALGELAGRWRETGGSPIVVEGPAGGAGGASVQAAAQALQAYGVPAESVQVTDTGADPAAPAAPVRVGFSRLAAIIPDCANRWDDLSRTNTNQTHAAFGCATRANMAAQIADPNDLLRPRAVAASDASRRATVMEKYRKGQSTASERADDERGVVSRSIQ